eukprot:CAMPEP_0197018088 /NCGR_PEP_ID=MMETSP1380-20130617/79903_1 /TAXON_ID=5936 /ORGANISM="Euplotes crassus, Strain CT5" /LENGTH=410 /DNA_ID=CAMNT_0042445261 /DNA_START=138 /DNA_END=1371 /DNA_ORIENTATION=-
MKNKEGLLVKSYNNPIPENASTSLDNYHTKSYEDVVKSSSSIMFKNINSQRPKPINGQINHKILAALANKNLKEGIMKKKSKKDLSADARIINAYSYDKEKKGHCKVPTMGSTADQEDHSEETTQELYQTEAQSFPEPHKQNSFINKISDDLDHGEDKHYGSEGKVNEYDEGLPKEFDSPFEYKAISPSPHLNTSAMSKEVALDDRSSRMKEDESKKDSKDFPLTAAKAIIYYRKYLSEYEESEILNYSLIYYINLRAPIDKKKVNKAKISQEFKVIKGEQLCYRYEIIESLGKGAFGEVIKCFDHKENEDVAIKILKNSSDNYEQGMNEVNILRYVKENDPDDVRNIIKIGDTFIFRNQICIGFEIMDMNLYDVIKGRNFRGMKVKYIRRIALHILVGLCFLARFNVIH